MEFRDGALNDGGESMKNSTAPNHVESAIQNAIWTMMKPQMSAIRRGDRGIAK